MIKVVYSLKINNLTKLYTNNKGIKDINLNLEEGSITTILGPSGAGKTTLLNALLNDQFKDKGSVSFYDYNLKDNYEDIMEMVGYLEDKLPTYPNLSLKEIFKNLNRYYNLDYYDNALKYLNMFNIDVNKKINELTSGEFKLINIIKALFHEPKYIDRVCYYWNYTKGSITKTNDFILNGFQGLCEGMIYAINFLTPLWNRGIVEDIRFLYLISNFIMFSYISYNNFARSGRSEKDLNKFLGWYREACKTTFFPYEDKITLELYDLWLENNEKDRAKPQYNLPVISFEDYIELLRT